MEQMNLLIRDIKDYIEKPRKGKLNESSFPSFLDFRKEMAPSVQYLKEEDEETEADENPFYSYREFITALETIDNTPKGIVAEANNGKLKDVNLIVGRFQPFHNGHLKMAKFLKEKNGNPAVAVVVYPGHNKSGKSPFNEDLIKKYMDGIVSDEKEIFDYIIVQRGLIGSAIVKLLEKGYKPNLIGAGEDRMDDYTKQLDYVKKSDIGDQMQNLKLVQTPRATSATEVRNAIKDEDYQKFKKLVPAGVEKMYAALKSAVDGKVQESFDPDEESNLIMEGEIFEGVTPDISLDGIRKDIDNLQEYLKALAERGSITDDERKKLSSVSDAVNRIKNLTKGYSADEEKLKSLVADLVFGSSGDKKSKGKKIHKIDNLFHDLSGPTMDNLISRYISNDDIKPISLDDIKNNLGGILDNLSSGLNGISGKDIKKIYNFDTSVSPGLQQRGKGETLFSLAFNSIKNDLAGGDVRSLDDDKVIEIKSSNNAGITPKEGPPLAMKVEDIIQNAGRLFDLPELKKNRIQKTSSESLMASIDEGGEKAEQFLTLVSDLSGIETPTSEDILPILLLFQLDYYSKELEEFQTFAIFIEREDAPEKIVILDSNGKTFVTPENIEALKKSQVAPKVTSADRVEIYMFNKKIKK
jgi:cytidyltransferase-like protein